MNGVHGDALVGDDQRDLAAAHHAEPCLNALPIGEAAELRAQATADELGGDAHQYQHQRKEDEPAGHAGDGNL